jgi:lipopolysaccharide transport system ATP-binding protein
MGFHPDFTGRQNALIAGQLMGMTGKEIEVLIPEIEKFADIGEYFDQTIRVYSSGMLARVAFAVATAIKPDILIVDEVLSVGDIAFQAKCMQRMESLLEGGSTILLVSHSPHTVRQFCHRAIYIANGTIVADGDTATVCDLYQNSLVHRADRSPGIEGSKVEYLSIFKEVQMPKWPNWISHPLLK